MLQSLQFLARVFEVGAYVTIFFVLGSLLEAEGIRACVARVRRLVQHHHS